MDPFFRLIGGICRCETISQSLTYIDFRSDEESYLPKFHK